MGPKSREGVEADWQRRVLSATQAETPQALAPAAEVALHDVEMPDGGQILS